MVLLIATSTMESANDIYFANKYSCSNTIISSAKKVVCSTNACGDSVIRDTYQIFMLDKQEDIVIYSGGIGIVYAYFKGTISDDSIIYYCNGGDTCYISCDKGSCKTQTTLIYCYGKCFINCDDVGSDGDADYSDGDECVNIKSSLSPTAAPFVAPSNAPTVPPTSAATEPPTHEPTDQPTYQPTDNQLLTAQEVSIYFNWVLIVVAIIMIICIIWGYNDAKYFHKNELFKIGALYSFAFYTNDFLSDIFFIIRLAVLGFNRDVERHDEFINLFIASCICCCTIDNEYYSITFRNIKMA